MDKKANFMKGLAIAALLAVVSTQASAFPFPRPGQVTIAGDRGGQVIQYALRAKKMEKEGRQVRFAGRCASACTLYLSMSRDLTCVTPGASFGFHLPYGASPRGNRIATEYLMRSYPGWVRNWIRANGGLTHHIKTMDYSYASKYLQSCNTASAFRI